MESYNELIARIQKLCLASAQNPSILCYLLRHSLRKLLDYTAAVAQLQFEQRSAYLCGFNTAPSFVRALRLAARTVNAGAALNEAHAQGVLVIRSHHLRAISLGRHLRPLASGDLLICAYIDTAGLSSSTFAFAGVCLGDIEQLKKVINTISPFLHQALFNSYLSHRRIVSWSGPGLTPAEEVVYRLLSDGLSNKKIAKILNRSDATIRNQLHAIFSKLGVGTRTEAIAKQRKHTPGHYLRSADGTIVVYN